jgi:hypothetical protein
MRTPFFYFLYLLVYLQGGTGPRIPDRGLVGRSGHQASKKKMDPPENHDQTGIFTISTADIKFICVI